MKSIISHSPEETKEIAKKWLVGISALEVSDEATVVGLCGHLGSGKTAFIQAIAGALDVKEQITSPTFVIMKIYKIGVSDLPWKRLVHIDAYRLEKPEELGALNFESIVADSHNLVMIEWADNIEKALPEGWKRIGFETLGEGERGIGFE